MTHVQRPRTTCECVQGNLRSSRSSCPFVCPTWKYALLHKKSIKTTHTHTHTHTHHLQGKHPKHTDLVLSHRHICLKMIDRLKKERVFTAIGEYCSGDDKKDTVVCVSTVSGNDSFSRRKEFFLYHHPGHEFGTRRRCNRSRTAQ